MKLARIFAKIRENKEGCRSGQSGRFAKPLVRKSREGSNPSPSALGFGRVPERSNGLVLKTMRLF